MIAFAPLLATVGNGVRWDRVLLLLVGSTVLLVVHWRRATQAIAAPTEPLPWRPSALTYVASVGLMIAAYGFLDPGNPLWGFLPAAAIAELLYGRSLAVAWRLTVLLAAGPSALVAVVTELIPTIPDDPLPVALVVAFVLLLMPFAELIVLWQWRVSVELDQARRDASDLGATRERLRFAEDLHDILGHALEVVSLKSELATRLMPVDPDRAHAEMVEVQRLARGALEDVRELARGRTRTDLEVELTGARTLLASAGIDCEVDVEAADERHSELFGRVLREAVTNLLRHADTRRCWITVRPAALTVENDGVTGAPPGTGTGLVGLARRVKAAGGEFTAGPGERPGTFAVRAVLA